jgi:pyruvate,water dikinase
MAGELVGYEADGILWLGEDDCHHDTIVGGKAASLSRLASLHAVPLGFAVPALPASVPAIPDALQGAIRHAYGSLADRCGAAAPRVAVRSSALDEDGSAASFAGQHDTYLNIRGPDAVLDAVQRCVRSAASNEALAYRKQRGLTVEDVRIAVLVQRLVEAQISAVVFSANPITGSREEVMINASWGLGESIVGGSVSPDTFVVTKQTFDVTMRAVSCKDRMTVMNEGGTIEVGVPEHLRNACTLEDDQLQAMTELAVKLERAVGYPVDIECAFAEDALYLLQCRPITTLG